MTTAAASRPLRRAAEQGTATEREVWPSCQAEVWGGLPAVPRDTATPARLLRALWPQVWRPALGTLRDPLASFWAGNTASLVGARAGYCQSLRSPDPPSVLAGLSSPRGPWDGWVAPSMRPREALLTSPTSHLWGRRVAYLLVKSVP